jgi:dihydrofolate reductase
MARLRFQISMSLDGFVAGPDQSVKNPLGVGGEQLHEWVFPLRTFKTLHGGEGGITGPDDDVLAENAANIGATIMGRHMFGGGTGGWPDPPWNGWWGDDPPFHSAVLVLTHHARAPQEMKGGTTFHFVTDGIHAALEWATRAAGGRDVAVAGGADAIQQYLRAGLIDEMDIHVVPVLLGGGARLFDRTDGVPARYESVHVISSPQVTHYKLRRKA